MPEIDELTLSHWALAPWLALAIAFATAAAEALPLRRLRLPAIAVLALLGGLAGLGSLPFWPLLAATALGALAGDAACFRAGRRHGLRLEMHWPFDRHPHRLAAARHHFTDLGGSGLLAARFQPAAHGLLPAVAGASGMAGGRFLAASLPGALLWAVARLAPAALTVVLLAAVARIGDRLAIAVAIGLLGILLAIWLARSGLRLGLPLLARLRSALLDWAARRGGRAGAAVERLAAPHHAEFRLLVLLALLIFLAIAGFLALLQGVATGDPLLRFDAGISRLAQGLRTPWIDSWVVAMTLLGDWLVTLSVAGAAAAVLLLAGAWRLAAGLGLSMAATMAFVQGIKLLVAAPRPIEIYGGADAFSFPSGHATLTAALYGILGLLAYRFLPRWLAVPAVAVCAALTAIVCLSRVYLAAHWPTDVIAGLLFGAGITAAFAIAFRAQALSRGAAGWLFGAAALALLAVGGWHIAQALPQAERFYAVREPAPQPLSEPWAEGGWRDLPDRRIDLEGEREEPLLLLWNGEGEALREALRAQGWQDAPGWSLAILDRFLQPRTGALELPALPRLDEGRRPVLTMLHAGSLGGQDGRFVLRAWPRLVAAPDRTGEGAGRIVLLGSVTFEPLHHPLGLLSVALPPEDGHHACDATAMLTVLPGARAVGASLRGEAEEGACGGQRVLAGSS